MSFKVKIRLLIILAVVMAASLICGCSIGLPGYEELQDQYEITSIVTYYANGGNFSTAAVISRELDFPTNQPFYNITESTTVSVKRSNYTFDDWYYVKSEYFTETDEEGNETEVLYFYLDVTDADMNAYPDDGEGGKVFTYTASYALEDDGGTYSLGYEIRFKKVDNEWIISQEDYDLFVRLKKNYTNDASLVVPNLQAGDIVDTSMVLKDGDHLYVVATWSKAQSLNYNLLLISMDDDNDGLTANVTGAVSGEEADDTTINSLGNTFVFEEGDEYTYPVKDAGTYLFTISSGDIEITVGNPNGDGTYSLNSSVNLYISNDSSSGSETSKEIEVAAGDEIIFHANAYSSVTYSLSGTLSQSLMTGDLLYRQYFGKQSSLSMPSNFNRVSGVVVDNYTFVGYYWDEEYTQTVSSVTKPDEEGEDVDIYVLYVKNALNYNGSYTDWTIVSDGASVRSMFSSGNGNYYVKNDIDCSTVSAASPMSSFRGRIEGNGYTISNLVISQTRISAGTAVAMFGTIYAGATINDLTLKDVSVTYSTMPVNIIYAYLICTDISGSKDDVNISGLTIDGIEMSVTLGTYAANVGGYTSVSNITRVDQAAQSVTYTYSHWKYGNGIDNFLQTDEEYDLEVTIKNETLTIIAGDETIEVYPPADIN